MTEVGSRQENNRLTRHTSHQKGATHTNGCPVSLEQQAAKLAGLVKAMVRVLLGIAGQVRGGIVARVVVLKRERGEEGSTTGGAVA